MGAFYTTRNFYRDYINYENPLSYDEWLAIADDNKAAVLYVQFYDQITLAWQKVKSFYTLEEDGVSTMMDYLIKNVELIKADKKRFSPRYIYRVAFNCLYCICHDLLRPRQTFENECSNLISCGEDTLDLFDLAAANDDDDISITLMSSKEDENFWKLFEDTDVDTQTVISRLIGEEPRNINLSKIQSWAEDEEAERLSDPDKHQNKLDSEPEEKKCLRMSNMCYLNNPEIAENHKVSRISASKLETIKENIKQILIANNYSR